MHRLSSHNYEYALAFLVGGLAPADSSRSWAHQTKMDRLLSVSAGILTRCDPFRAVVECQRPLLPQTPILPELTRLDCLPRALCLARTLSVVFGNDLEAAGGNAY